jgi:hypothetical protein
LPRTRDAAQGVATRSVHSHLLIRPRQRPHAPRRKFGARLFEGGGVEVESDLHPMGDHLREAIRRESSQPQVRRCEQRPLVGHRHAPLEVATAGLRLVRTEAATPHAPEHRLRNSAISLSSNSAASSSHMDHDRGRGSGRSRGMMLLPLSLTSARFRNRMKLVQLEG